MVLDEVADGLRQYRKEANPEKRVGWLKKLAPTRDPRVAVQMAVIANGDDHVQLPGGEIHSVLLVCRDCGKVPPSRS